MLDDWFDIEFDMEVLGNPKFWIVLVVSFGILSYILSTWIGKVQGLLGFYIMGAIASVVLSYVLTIRDLEKNG